MSKFQKPEREKCPKCTKSVFSDSIKIDSKTFHKSCFSCKICSKALNEKTFFKNKEDYYCQKHYKELSEIKPIIENKRKETSWVSKIQLDQDSLINIFQFLSFIEIARLSRVDSVWYEATNMDQSYWKTQSLLIWPASDQMKVQNWREFLNQRSNLEKLEKKKTIQNCKMKDWKFVCPLSWDNLKATGDQMVRQCNVCNEKVYHCIDIEELDTKSKEGKCVMFDPNYIVGYDDSSIAPRVSFVRMYGGRKCF